jgi:hypothetical protein
MSRFTTPLRIEDTGIVHDGRVIFRLLESFDYELGAERSGYVIHVPIGFETDYASVPSFFWRFLPPWGQYGKAAVLHDFLYRKASGFSKVLADSIFYEAMDLLGVPWWKRCVMYWGVSLFGHSSYNWEAPSLPSTEVKILTPAGDVKREFMEPSLKVKQ